MQHASHLTLEMNDIDYYRECSIRRVVPLSRVPQNGKLSQRLMDYKIILLSISVSGPPRGPEYPLAAASRGRT
jgi:hypothetical protein